MKKSLAHLMYALCVCSLCLVAGCNSSPTITLSFSPSSQAIDNGQSVTITVTITDSKNAGVKWTLSGPGALSNQAATSVTYTAAANGGGTATITATSVTDPKKSAVVTITVTAPPAITTTTLSAGVQGTAYNQTIAVTGGAGTLTYSITVGTLPAGLSLNSSTGAITGTPTGVAGTANFTVKVTDSSTGGAQSSTQALSIKINLPPAPQITTTTLPAGVEFTAYNQAVALTGGLGPFTWSVTTGALPAGLTIAAGTGVISGSPTGPNGTTSFTVKVMDSSNPPQSATQALSITINLPPAPSITTTTMANGVEFTAYNQTLTTSGGHAPLTFSISVGALPAGLTLNVNTGAITGTPTGPSGTTSFTAKVTDSSNPVQSATQALSITITLPPAPMITTTSLPNGVEGTAYSQTIATTGGHAPLTFSISVGALPAGLTIAAGTGVISGTPTGPNGTASFTVKVTDTSNPVQSATQALSITINLPPAPAITTTSPLPNGSIGSAYSQTLAVSGGLGPFAWSLFSGTLPAGLSLTANTGVISGTPTANAVSNFTVQVTDSSNPAQSAQKALSITIAAAPLSITTTGLPNGVVGQAYNGAMLLSAGGAPPVTWSISVGSLPAGLTLIASTGAITGTPTGPAGTIAFTVKATDSSVPTVQTATKLLSIQVIAALSITTTTLPAGTVNTPYSQTLLATGGTTPITWSITVGALPAGLTLTASTGVISGTPTGPAGTTNFTVKATDSTTPTAQTKTQALSITINVAPLAISTTTLANGAIGTAYNQMLLATGGTPPVTWSITVGALPAGLTLTASTGVISGTPTAPAGTASFTVKATDSTTPTAQTATQALSITVSSSGTLTCPLLSGGSESLLSAGAYAAQFNGWNDTKGMFQATASFTSDGAGNIPNGVADSNGVGQTPQNLTMTAGCYNLGSDHRGKMIWNFGAGNTVTFSLVMRADGKNGDLIEFDDTTGTSKTRGSGSIRRQDTTLFVAGTLTSAWAFGVRGVKSDGTRTGSLGAFSLDGVSALTGGAVDYSEPGTSFTNLTAAGSFTAPDATHGRGTLTITIQVPAPIGALTLHFAYYITRGGVGTTPVVFLQSTDTPDSVGHALQNGVMAKQTVPGGGFSNTSINGTVIFALTGFDTSHAITNTLVGLATSPGDGTFTGVGDQEADAAPVINTVISGTIAIGANGLGVVQITAPVAQVPTSIVMVAPNTALMLEGTAVAPNADDVVTGILQPQTGGGTFTPASLSGTLIFGSDEPATTATNVDVGTVVINSPGVITITQDSSNTSGLQSAKVMTGTYTMATNGRGDITITSGGTGTAVIYLFNANKAVVMPRGGGDIAILNLEQ